MTATRHTPLPFGGPLTSAAMESPLSQLDTAIVAEEAARAAAIVAANAAIAAEASRATAIENVMIAGAAGGWTTVPAEVADARGAYATLGERLRLASFATQFAADSARAAARAHTADVPPGVVVTGPSAAGAATAIAGGVDVAPTDSGTFVIDTTHFRYSLSTPVNIQPGWPRTFVRGSGVDSTYAEPPIGLEFDYNGTLLEFQVRGDGAGKNYAVCVGGRLVATLVPGLPSDGSNYRYLVTFPDARWRTVRIEADGALGPVTREPAATVALPESPAGPRVIVLGDSWTEGTGAGSSLFGYVRRLGEILGWRDVWSSGSGGTGYLTDGITTPPRKTFRARSATDVIAPAPNVVIVAGGINDTAFTGAQVGAEATLLYAALVAGLPDVQVIVIGPWWPKAASTVTDPVEANRVAIRAAAIAAGFYFIDPIEEGWITGTGHVGDPHGDGNADVFISADGAHPSAAGHQYIAERLAGHLLTVGWIASNEIGGSAGQVGSSAGGSSAGRLPVQSVVTIQNGTTPVVCTLIAPPTVGNVLLAVIGTSIAATGITQTNVAWTELVGEINGTTWPCASVSLWVGIVSASPGTSVSVAFVSGGAGSIMIYEWAGLEGVLDQTAHRSGTLTNGYSGSTAGDTIIPTQQQALVIEVVMQGANTSPTVLLGPLCASASAFVNLCATAYGFPGIVPCSATAQGTVDAPFSLLVASIL